MRLVRIAAVVGGLGLVLVGATPAAFAGGNGAQTFTQHDRDVTRVKADVRVPCISGTGLRTFHYSDVFHGTINKTGSWFTGTVHGTVTFVPNDSSAPTYTGHFTTWFGDENNLKNDVEHSTFSLHLTASDGSKSNVHGTSHASTNANGVVTVVFNKFRCG